MKYIVYIIATITLIVAVLSCFIQGVSSSLVCFFFGIVLLGTALIESKKSNEVNASETP